MTKEEFLNLIYESSNRIYALNTEIDEEFINFLIFRIQDGWNYIQKKRADD